MLCIIAHQLAILLRSFFLKCFYNSLQYTYTYVYTYLLIDLTLQSHSVMTLMSVNQTPISRLASILGLHTAGLLLITLSLSFSLSLSLSLSLFHSLSIDLFVTPLSLSSHKASQQKKCMQHSIQISILYSCDTIEILNYTAFSPKIGSLTIMMHSILLFLLIGPTQTVATLLGAFSAPARQAFRALFHMTVASTQMNAPRVGYQKIYRCIEFLLNYPSKVFVR